MSPFIELDNSSNPLVKRLTDADVLQHPARPADICNWRITPRPEPGDSFPKGDYGLLPYDVGHEPLVRSIPDPLGRFAEIGHITRNSYGCEVLCTRLLPIIDVDHAFRPEADRRVVGPVFTGTWCTEEQVISAARYLSSGCTLTPTPGRTYGQSLEHDYAFERLFPFLPEDLGIAGLNLEITVFRTYAGWRLTINQAAPLSGFGIHPLCGLMRFLYADPKYVEIAQQQGTYRARLTAKPWRAVQECEKFDRNIVVELVGTAAKGRFSHGTKPRLQDPALKVLFGLLSEPHEQTFPHREDQSQIAA